MDWSEEFKKVPTRRLASVGRKREVGQALKRNEAICLSGHDVANSRGHAAAQDRAHSPDLGFNLNDRTHRDWSVLDAAGHVNARLVLNAPFDREPSVSERLPELAGSCAFERCGNVEYSAVRK